ncbi:MAG: TIGR00270 family protein [Nitrososphaeria archaeon]|nr:TIGR00270 family protein [Nitrososphaeria archaeon]NIN53408.1 TIGR00270 family protein [Nitrososphaeria archaeon]NIQ33920.1 TIGR00270 family protein [Nitrososphaeria archaeon]
MQCEICGGENTFVLPSIFEGSRVYACGNCRKSYNLVTIKPKRTTSLRPPTQRSRIKPRAAVLEDYILVEGYGKLIRSARETRSLTQKDLAKLLNERVSIVKKVESEKISPSSPLIRKLEHVLRVQLQEKAEREVIDKDEDLDEGLPLTLGDLAVFKKEGNE